jgi:hypothetical protein
MKGVFFFLGMEELEIATQKKTKQEVNAQDSLQSFK